MRPASDSVTLGSSRRLADPVSRNRPGRRSWSTAILITGSSSGARWISSKVTASGKFCRKPAGSVRAVSKCLGLSML